mmetsp:Transcript_4411/g.8506  ORF Transcript_4411/g.8506 Transcript_4411/m.8506 type:complete len:222 (-) Transcript_4411:118-783(-)|eukprot:CAMPEP_0176480816 /NCGR_PEP_ID=MMETSP0200_2-20121128/2481_1 /TAXON_ID=947934 /ORGANISM="Chaetoceros sp., Strain GSL56" /LENGTH=221 /DNA_ID=CAMNT_0017876965 /DNA_START=90 /DNA_END=755 /DNA_ORIENTATION=+
MSSFIENTLHKGKSAGKKAKLKAEILLLERSITNRKKQFGIDLYNDLQDITCQQEFYATTDQTIDAVRPELLSLDREMRALDAKRMRAKGNLDLAEDTKREAFHVPATNWKERAANVGKGAGMVAIETKIKAELRVIHAQMHALKESFGITMYAVLENLFGSSANPIAVHSSTDDVVNQIRERYNTCKADIIEINRKIIQKEVMIDQLGIESSLRSISGGN